MTRILLAIMTGLVAFLLVSNPFVVDAARQVTGFDIKNNTVASVDIKNGTVGSLDVKDGSLMVRDLAPRQLPPRPTLVTWTVVHKANGTKGAQGISKMRVPAFAQVSTASFKLLKSQNECNLGLNIALGDKGLSLNNGGQDLINAGNMPRQLTYQAYCDDFTPVPDFTLTYKFLMIEAGSPTNRTWR